METLRLFVAIPLDESWKHTAALPSEKYSAASGLRYIPPANFHITQFFIGDCPAGYKATILSLLEEIVPARHSFLLQAEGYRLVHGRKPSMLWLQFQPCRAFTDMQQDIANALQDLTGAKTLFHDPVPHVTLARLKAAFRPALYPTLPDQKGTLEVRRLELWETQRNATGVAYR
ncbi:MAG: RNA 2',3'-cyclic phosphodiesterase, partial [Bacteroidia bacterium]|nr:RNA 2',3'-cyclic phosphodiesterase [Bacteroidia bacterium]